MAALLVTGDLSVQGNIKGLRSLVEPLQVAMDNGARRALISLENKRNFLEVTGDIIEHVDPIFFGDPKTAAFKALGLNRRSIWANCTDPRPSPRRHCPDRSRLFDSGEDPNFNRLKSACSL